MASDGKIMHSKDLFVSLQERVDWITRGSRNEICETGPAAPAIAQFGASLRSVWLVERLGGGVFLKLAIGRR